jgi:hypothetical protein
VLPTNRPENLENLEITGNFDLKKIMTGGSGPEKNDIWGQRAPAILCQS